MHFGEPWHWKKGDFRVFFGIKAQTFSKAGDIDQVSYIISFKGKEKSICTV